MYTTEESDRCIENQVGLGNVGGNGGDVCIPPDSRARAFFLEPEATKAAKHCSVRRYRTKGRASITDLISRPLRVSADLNSSYWNRLELYKEVWSQPLVKLSRIRCQARESVPATQNTPPRTRLFGAEGGGSTCCTSSASGVRETAKKDSRNIRLIAALAAMPTVLPYHVLPFFLLVGDQ